MTENAPRLTDAAGRRFPLAVPVTMLGRSPKCDVFIPDRRVSRRHAEIHWDGETATLHDMDSANGAILNGRRITAPQPLHDGDEIGIGSAVFTFRDPEATIRVDNLPLLVVDEASGEIWVNRTPVALSPKEQALFELLYRNTGQICSKQQVASVVWPEYQAEVYDYQIESLVKRLREKLEPDPRRPVLIITARGRGYKLV
ncbi:MAG: FHA domain-containing protein [Chloroflexota bacterium]|nr:FHA domain-containing protein [Chloroflexota bacterium]